MQGQVRLLGRDLRVEWSQAAQRALEARSTPLLVEMELYFSCMIRKRVRFDVRQRGEAALLGQGLSISFRPVMTPVCSVADYDPESLVDLPTGEPQRFMPHWLKLDYRHGQWQGEFGYEPT